jgi:hypothetical protein
MRDITGGTNINQNIEAALRCWGVRLDFRQSSFDQAWTWGQKATMAVSISISYRPVSTTRFNASPGFVGNHQVILSGGKVYDPLADGRRAGIPIGPQVWPKSLLRTAAGRVNIAAPGHPYRALGEGTALCVLAYAPVAKPTKYSVAFEPGAFFTYHYAGGIWQRDRDEGFSKNTSAPCASPETIPWLDGRKRVVQITAGRLNGLRVEPGATHLKLLEKK